MKLVEYMCLLGAVLAETFRGNKNSSLRPCEAMPQHPTLVGKTAAAMTNELNNLTRVRLTIVVLLALFAGSVRPACAQGEVTDLGTLGGSSSQALGVNDSGTVVGWSLKSNGKRAAFVANGAVANSMSELPEPFGSLSTASAINDYGEICGWVRATGSKLHAWMWNGAVSDIHTAPGGPASLGATVSSAYGINDSSQVVGDMTLGNGTVHGFVWQPSTGATMLSSLGGGESHARGINQQGWIVGYSKDAQGFDRACVWMPARNLVELGVLPGGSASRAYAIDDEGYAVGEALVPIGSAAWHATRFFWLTGDPPQDLGTLGGDNSVLRGTAGPEAVGSSQVAGGSLHALEAYDAKLTDDTIVNPTGLQLVEFQWINRHAFMGVGYGTLNGKQHAISDGLGGPPESGTRGIGSVACNRAAVVGSETLSGTLAVYQVDLLGVVWNDNSYPTVRLHSSNPSVLSVPYSVVLPAGQLTVDFPISTSPVAVETDVTITYDLPPGYSDDGAPIVIHVYPTSATTLSVTNISGKIGEAVTLSAQLTQNIDGYPATGKTVAFSVAGANARSAVIDVNGNASVSYTIPESVGTGAKTISASFAGTPTYGASTGSASLTVSKGDASLLLPNATGAIGQTIDLVATLTKSIGGAPISGATVTFKVAGASVGHATTDSTGSAHLAYTVPEVSAIGTLALTASSAATSLYQAASASATLTVTKAATTAKAATVGGFRGDTVTLSATLTRSTDLAPLAGRTISFYLGATKLASGVTDSSGTAQTSYTISASAAIGTISYTAKFAGDAKHKASSGSGKIYVKDTTSIAVSPVSGMIGQTVILSATLKRSTDGLALSGKTLSFSVDGTIVGTATTSTSGVATKSYKFPFSDSMRTGVGNRTVSVSFAGDAGYAASTSTGVLTVVKTSTSVTVTNVSGAPGAKITLKAIVKRTTDGGGVSGGSVTFKVDGVLAGTATTGSSGSASTSYPIPTSFASGSMHTITVEFAGNASYGASTGQGVLTVL